MGASVSSMPRSLRMRMLAPSAIARLASLQSFASAARRLSSGSPSTGKYMGSVAARKSGKTFFAQLRQVVLREDRVRQLEHPALAGRLLEEVALAADAAHERHHDLLAERVDRRVRDLREQLLEVAEEQLGLLREDGERDVDAHRAHRLLAERGHRPEDHPQILLGVAEGLLQAPEVRVRDGVEARHVLEGAQIDLVLGDPRRVRLLRRDAALDLVVADDAALARVDEEHLARLEAPLLDDARRLDVEDAELAREHDEPVARHDVLRRGAARSGRASRR